jgi:hypothetical protein
MPMLQERMACLREAGQVLYEVNPPNSHLPSCPSEAHPLTEILVQFHKLHHRQLQLRCCPGKPPVRLLWLFPRRVSL